MDSIQDILNKYWNHKRFRDPQENIIKSVLNDHDVLTLLPTGSGKSLCFQIPALMKSGICIVISPLIALMEDQVSSLQKKGIKAIALTSKYNIEETIKAFDNLQFGNYKFLYLSPEKLQSEFIQGKIKQLKVNLIAVDEAHCISEWGHDFRPNYLKISILKESHPDTNIIALTASATPKVAKDIIDNLSLKNVQIFKKSFSRNNLIYNIFKTENTRGKLKQILAKIKEPVIVYTNSRKSCIDISNFLNQQNFKSSYYHGGLQNKDKLIAYENWMLEKTPIIVATNAFGMGIDKSNVRAVIHMNLPNSIENYLQEVGRAGRDNIQSYVYLLYNDSTIFNSTNYLNKGLASPKDHKEVYINLNQYYQISNGEFSEKPYEFNLNEFCLKYKLSLLKTKHVLNLLNHENIIELQQNAYKKSSIKIIVSNSYLLLYESKNNILDALLKVILRNYGGIFEQFIPVNESFIGKKLMVNKSKVIEWLNQLELDKIIIYNRATENVQLKFKVPREDNFVINKITKNIEQKNTVKTEKAHSMINYVQNDQICRNILLQRYFGETAMNKCNQCDVCSQSKTEIRKVNLKDVGYDILELFNLNKILSFEEIQNQLKYEKKYVIKTLQLMIEHETIRLTSLNRFEKIKNE